MDKTRWWLAVSIALLAAIALTWRAEAKPGGGKPPKDPPEILAGTVYFRLSGQVWRMGPDGNGKTLMADATPGVPTRDLHRGKRWFLSAQPVDGSPYLEGLSRQELFAVAEDGTSVQLTDDETLMLWEPAWVNRPGVGRDGRIAAIGLRFASGVPVEGGVYLAAVAFDPDYEGGIVGTMSAPTLHVAFDLVEDGPPCVVPDLTSFSFDPDGAAFVYRQRSSQRLFVHGATGTTQIAEGGAWPAWSPDGTTIAFTWDGLYTVRPDGSGTKRLVNTNAKMRVGGGPTWSPTSEHLLYVWGDYSRSVQNIYRVAASGAGKTSLTDDIGGFPYHLGWR